MMVIAATLQFVLVYDFKNKCAGHDISTAPAVAGVCVLGSFVLNAIWLSARKKQAKTAIRAALFVWTSAVTIGVAAAGAALGQSFMYEAVCVDSGQSTLDTEINIQTLQYLSIALLVLSVAAPHALKRKGTTMGGSGAGQPLTGDSQLKEVKPLVFL